MTIDRIILHAAAEALRPNHPAARLRALADALETGQPMQDADIAAGLRRYLEAPEEWTLDAALGLAAGQGQEPWWRARQRARRDDHLRDLATRLCPDARPGPAARVIADAVRRYEASSYRLDKHNIEPPESIVGTWKECAWLALKCGRIPSSTRQLENILGAKL